MLHYEPTLPDECYKYAEVNLGETNEIRENSLMEIHRWLDEHPNINANRDVQVLLYFLRATKFHLDKAKKKIKKFYKMRAERLEWYGNRDPFIPSLMELLDLGVFLPLRQKDENNRLVVIIRIAAHDPTKHLQDNVLKVGKMILDLALHLDESVSVYGLVAIFDMKNVALGHALQMPPPLIKRLVESWECYPCLIKGLEFVNAPIYVNFVLNTFRFFMSAKLKSRLSVSKSTSKHDVQLPAELGGTGDSYADLATYWKSKVQENIAWYNETDKYKSIK